MIQDIKLQLIQWILEIQNPETLQNLLQWKEKQKKEREERFFRSCGAWQEDEGSDLMEDIYGSRYFEERDIEL